MTQIKILVIEDKKIFVRQIQRRLINLGYPAPIFVSFGVDAVQAVAEIEPDLILISIIPKDKINDALEITQLIRKRFDIPVVHLLDHLDNEILRQAEITHPSAYLLKPFKPREVHLTVETALYRRHLEKKLAASEQRLTAALTERHETGVIEREQRLLAETLGRVGLALNAVLDLPDLLDLICQESMTLFKVKAAYVWLVQGDELVGFAGYGQAREQFVGLRLSLADPYTLGPRVVREKRPILVNEAAKSNQINQKLRQLLEIKAILGVPLIKGDKAVGALIISDTEQAQRFGPDDLETATVLGNYAAIAIENARLYSETRRRLEEQNALREAGTIISSTLELEIVLRRIAEQMGQIVEATSAYICGLDPEQMVSTLLAEYFSPAAHALETVSELGSTYDLLRDFPEISAALQAGKVALFHLNDPELTGPMQAYMQQYGIQTMLDIPLQVGGQVIAYAELCDSRQRDFTPAEIALCQDIAQQAAVAIQNARLFNKTRRQAQQLAILNELAGKMTGLLEVRDLCTIVAECVHSAFGYLNVAVFTTDLATRELVLQVNMGDYTDRVEPGNYRQAFGAGIIGQAAEKGEIVLVNNTQKHPDFFELEGGKIRSELAIPLKIGKQVVGVLNMDSDRFNTFDESDVAALTTVADQLAIALEKARLFDETCRWAEQLEALRQVSQDLIALRDLDTLLHQIAEQAAQLLNAEGGNVYLYRPELEVLELVIVLGEGGPAGVTLRPGEGITGRVWAKGEPLIINDYRQWPDKALRWAHFPALAMMGVPIQWGAEALGVLNIYTKNPKRHFTLEDATLLTQFATQAAIAIHNARLYQAERARYYEAEAMRRAALALTSSIAMDQVLKRILTELQRVVPYDSASVQLLKEDRLEIIGGHGFPNLPELLGVSFPIQGDNPNTLVLKSREPIIIHDVSQDYSAFRQEPHAAANIHAWMGIPLFINDRAIGMLALDRRVPNFYTEAHAHAAMTYAAQAAVAIENARLYEQVQHHAAELEAVRHITLSLTASLDLVIVLDTILEGAFKLLHGIKYAHIFLYEAESGRLNFGAALGADGHKGRPFVDPRPAGFTYTVAQRRELIVVPDMQNHPLYADAPPDWSGAIIGLPLTISERVVGVMSVSYPQPRAIPESELNLLHLLGDQAAIAIENARLYEQAQRHAAELEMRVAERTFELQVLYELTHALGQTTQLGDMIRLILLHLYQAIPYDVAASLLVIDSTGTLVIQSQRPVSPRVESNLQEIMSMVLKQPLANDALEVRRIQSKIEASARPPLEDLASIMQVPIIVDKTPVGLLLVATERSEQFDQEQLHLLRTVADQAAESIRRLQLLLAAEHQRLESLVAHLPDGVVLLDSDRHVVLANPVGQKFLAILTQATTGDKLTWLGSQPIEMVLNHDSTGLPQEIELPGYPRQVFEIMAQPMAVGPEAGGWTLMIRDVTEDRAAQERAQQQDRLVAVGQLAAGIAHDFNNILTSIIGFAELARIHPTIPQPVGEDLQRIIHQGQRAARLVRQILDFSRQSITEKRPIDLVAFLKETIKLLERTIPEDIRITVEIEPGGHEAYTLNADPTQLTQVLTNLAVNARDAMPAGGILQFRLSIFILNPGERPPYLEMSPGYWIALSISDTGAGIVPEILPRIFEPFFTTKEVGKGTGLGLAQVYGIITQHEGYIDVNTQVEQGTTFTLYLPAAIPLSKPLSATIETETTRGHGEVILLVEDDQDVLEVTQAMLEHLGYRVVTATNGRQALEVYDQHQAEIALVLTDVTMPEMGGVVLSQTLQAKYPAIKVVALTGYPLEEESKDLLAQGIIDWLQKPLDRRQLGQTISRSLKLETKNLVGSEG